MYAAGSKAMNRTTNYIHGAISNAGSQLQKRKVRERKKQVEKGIFMNKVVVKG